MYLFFFKKKRTKKKYISYASCELVTSFQFWHKLFFDMFIASKRYVYDIEILRVVMLYIVYYTIHNILWLYFLVFLSKVFLKNSKHVRCIDLSNNCKYSFFVYTSISVDSRRLLLQFHCRVHDISKNGK